MEEATGEREVSVSGFTKVHEFDEIEELVLKLHALVEVLSVLFAHLANLVVNIVGQLGAVVFDEGKTARAKYQVLVAPFLLFDLVNEISQPVLII